LRKDTKKCEQFSSNYDDLTAELVTLINPDGPAFETIKHLTDDELYNNNEEGLKLIWQLLDERFPLKERMDKKGSAMQEIFSLKPLRGETSSGYGGRAHSTFNKARANEIVLDADLQGFIFLRATRMKQEQQGLVLSLSQQSWHIDLLITALRMAFPDRLPEPSAPTSLFLADDTAYSVREIHEQETTTLAKTSSGGAESSADEVQDYLNETILDHAIAVLFSAAREEGDPLEDQRSLSILPRGRRLERRSPRKS